MKPRLARFFLMLFVWLQCLAPLLHAHAGENDHSGLHLPEEVGLQTPGAHALVLTQHPHADDMHVIGISQGHRADQPSQPVADTHAQAAPFSISPTTAPPLLAAVLHLTPPPPRISRLLLLPGAPPSL